MSRPEDRPLPAVALGLALAFVVVAPAVSMGGRWLVEAMLPMLLTVLKWAANDFRLLGLAIVKEGPDTVLEARAMLEHVIVLGGRAVVPDGHTGFAVTTTLGTVLQPVVIAAVLVLGWPGRWRDMTIRLPIAAVLTAVIVALDAPLVLAASLWDMQVRAHGPDGVSPLLSWWGFMSHGGRQLLGLAAGAAAILAAGPQRLSFRSHLQFTES
jgi:hypothetical protein